MDYITKDTTYTSFVPCPCELLEPDVPDAILRAYLTLLRRALLSKSNDWMDENGHVYIVFPVEKLAAAMGKKRFAAQHALNELEKRQLIERKRVSFGQANLIFVKLPNAAHDDVHKTDQPVDSRLKKQASVDWNNRPKMTEKAGSNYNKNSYNKKNYTPITEEIDFNEVLRKKGLLK